MFVWCSKQSDQFGVGAKFKLISFLAGPTEFLRISVEVLMMMMHLQSCCATVVQGGCNCAGADDDAACDWLLF